MAYKIDKNRLIAKFLLDNTDTIELFETFYGHINMYQQYGLDMNDSKKTLITAIHRLQSGCTFVEKDCLRRWKLMILYDRTAYDEWVKQTASQLLMNYITTSPIYGRYPSSATFARYQREVDRHDALHMQLPQSPSQPNETVLHQPSWLLLSSNPQPNESAPNMASGTWRTHNMVQILTARQRGYSKLERHIQERGYPIVKSLEKQKLREINLKGIEEMDKIFSSAWTCNYTLIFGTKAGQLYTLMMNKRQLLQQIHIPLRVELPRQQLPSASTQDVAVASTSSIRIQPEPQVGNDASQHISRPTDGTHSLPATDQHEDANEDANGDANQDANVDGNQDANVDANGDANVNVNGDANQDANVDANEEEPPSIWDIQMSPDHCMASITMRNRPHIVLIDAASNDTVAIIHDQYIDTSTTSFVNTSWITNSALISITTNGICNVVNTEKAEDACIPCNDSMVPIFSAQRMYACSTPCTITAACMNKTNMEYMFVTDTGDLGTYNIEAMKQTLSKKAAGKSTTAYCVATQSPHDGFYAIGRMGKMSLVDARTFTTFTDVPLRIANSAVRSISFADSIVAIGTSVGVLSLYDIRANSNLPFAEHNLHGTNLHCSPAVCHPNQPPPDYLSRSLLKMPCLYTVGFNHAGNYLFAAGGSLEKHVKSSFACYWH